MPRGVYLRKKKGEAAVPAASKKAQSVKAAPTRHHVKNTEPESPTCASTQLKQENSAQASPVQVGDAVYGFQILGANISTLTESYERLKGEPSNLVQLISTELEETVGTLSALRKRVFSNLLPADPIMAATLPSADKEYEAASAIEAAPEEVAPPAPLPMPTLPQGNASFTPPAPPTLPRH